LWLILLPLIAVVLVPTVCVLWFANRAMRNEQLAVQQRLTEAYRLQLISAQRRLDEYWQARLDDLRTAETMPSVGEAFAQLVRTGHFAAAIILDAEGHVSYPSAAPWHPPPISANETWDAAAAAEHEDPSLPRAIELYEEIIGKSSDPQERARALVAQARCLTKAGEKAAAVGILTEKLSDAQYRNATDASGGLIIPNAQLMALRLLDANSPQHQRIFGDLVSRLNDYGEPAMPAPQRLHLMGEVQPIAAGPARMATSRVANTVEGSAGDSSFNLDALFPTLEAERLAATYLDADQPPSAGKGSLEATALPGVLRWVPRGQRIVALFSGQRLADALAALAVADISSHDITVKLVPPGTGTSGAFLTIPATRAMPDWTLALYLPGTKPFETAARRQAAAYVWTGALAVMVVILLTFVVIRQVRKHVRLAELQNNLVATVSHELKTPLSSIRLLLEVLAENECQDRDQVREYVTLITSQTDRLDRLVEHFLAYSRMEQRRHTFVMVTVEPARIVQAAVESVHQRCAAAGAHLAVEVAPDLPTVRGDGEALVTVLVNLLDNACKYCENQPQVLLRAYAADGQVCFAVRDNGIGLSRRSVKRIFDRFYQVDQRLSRNTGGCGLGLSIVSFIVDAHGGSVQVASEPGKGSTFTVKLPVAPQR
jgi:signal transduction histidine kinase